jgi:hypothetical protein
MKFFIALLAVAYCFEPLITRDIVDYLKRTVDWEVEDYETNIFRGWTVDEVKNLLGYTGFGDDSIEPIGDVMAPSEIDWTGANCDHGSKNQGSCGSCWAFAIVGMMSYRCCAAKSDYGWLSPQELVSCDKANHGCNGGQLASPMRYIQSNKGLVPETCFPYVAANVACPHKCADKSDWVKAHVCNCVKYVSCPVNDGMEKCLASGPVTFGFRVERSFVNYKSGIYKCTGGEILGGHAVLAMGISKTPECHYTVKNSWGPSWGENGYFKFACGTCGMEGGVACTEF